MSDNNKTFWADLGKAVVATAALTGVSYGVALGVTYLANKAGLVDDKAKVVLSSGSIAR